MSTIEGQTSENEGAHRHVSEIARGTRQCWVCQQEDIDDTPANNVWRAPCPCSLTAHDTCLLEWISNEEAPRRGEIARDRKIKCPQCRAEIKIQRPRDYLVTSYEAAQRIANAMILPGAAASVLMCTYAGLLVYGMNTFRVVFGYAEAQNILQSQTPTIEKISVVTKVFTDIMKKFDPLIPTTHLLDISKVFIGLPLIAPSLIVLRTRWAERVFSFMLPWYFMHPANQKLTWPPPPGLVFASLPYLKTAYNELYRYVFRKWETKWDMAVQRKPRLGETQEQIASEAERENSEGFLEIRLALTEEENNDIPRPEEEPPAERVRRLHLQNLPRAINPTDIVPNDQSTPRPLARIENNILDDIHAPPTRDAFERNEAQIRNEQQPMNRIANLVEQRANVLNNPEFILNDLQPLEQELIRRQNNGHQAFEDRPNNANILPDDDWTVVHRIPASQLISLMVGALVFPPVAAVAGEILKYTLPSNLIAPNVTYSWGNKVLKRGILTEKWGRTVVGGCLFVVLKDAFTLYCKWKRAREFGKRVIVDYTGPRNVTI